jgi:serine/threonine protein kinase
VNGFIVPGDVLPDGIEIISEYASGGMGVLFRARDLRTDAECLVKIAKVDGCSDEEKIRRWKRLEREGHALIKIQNPNVVSLKTIRTHENAPYLVFPLYSGKWTTLKTILDAQERPSNQAIVEIFREILAGVRAIHEAGFIHRDLKPGNILVCEDQPRRAVIIDLGIARSVLDDIDDLDKPGESPGTPSYIAPEIIHGDCVDHRADIFSIGCMLYRALTWRSAYPAQNRMEAARVFERGDAKIDAEIADPELSEICQDAIQINPDHRLSLALFASRLGTVPLTRASQKPMIRDDDTSFGNIAADIEKAALWKYKEDPKPTEHQNDAPISRHHRTLSVLQKSLLASVVIIGILSAIHDGFGKAQTDDALLTLGQGHSKPLETQTLGLHVDHMLQREKHESETIDAAPIRAESSKDPIFENPSFQAQHTHARSTKNTTPPKPKMPSWFPPHWEGIDHARYQRKRLDDTDQDQEINQKLVSHISPSRTYAGILLNTLSSHSPGTRAIIELTEPIRSGNFVIPRRSRVTGNVSHHLVGKNGCRAHVAVDSITLPHGEHFKMDGLATIAGVAGLPCKIFGNIEQRKERAITNGLIDIASQALAAAIPKVSPVTSRLGNATKEDVQELTEKDPEAVVNAHVHVDLQLDGGR